MKRFSVKNRIDERLLLAYLMAVTAGLVLIYSSSSMIAESRFGSHAFFFTNQLTWTVLSFAVIWIVCKLDLKRLSVYSVPALFITLLLLAVVFMMPARNGAHRWIFLGFFSVQPSELFKFVMIMFLAFSLSNHKRDLKKLKNLVSPYLPIIGTALLLILLEPDLGSVIVISITALLMFFLAGTPMKYLFATALPIAGAASFFVFVLGYKKERLIDYLASIADPLSGSYQVKQAALTLGSGGLFGTGLGDGRQKLFFLPYPHTDFIFASAGEEIGLIGLTLLLSIMFYLLWRGLKISAAQPDRFGYLLGAGMVVTLFTSIAINIGVVTALLPVTGLPLPFISYGGSSLLISSAAVGVLLNLSRKAGKI
ncbi:MAG: putative lipid II flippase FtsW [candidate division Zixibacteria bacterium]